MKRIYKARDKVDGMWAWWIVCGDEVSVMFPPGNGEMESVQYTADLGLFDMEGISRFNDAIDPVLLVEW